MHNIQNYNQFAEIMNKKFVKNTPTIWVNRFSLEKKKRSQI